MRKRTSLILATCALLLFVGSGCSESDMNSVFNFLTKWWEKHDIADKDGKPGPGMPGFVASGGEIKSGDNATDFLGDGGESVDSMRQADKKLDDADAALKKNPPDDRKALDLSDEAVHDRPKDMGVRSRRGVILTLTGNDAEGQRFLASTNDECGKAGMTKAQIERCISMVEAEGNAFRESQPRGGTNCKTVLGWQRADHRLSELYHDLAEMTARDAVLYKDNTLEEKAKNLFQEADNNDSTSESTFNRWGRDCIKH